MSLSDYRVTVPEGTCGAWAVRRYSVSEEQAKWERLRAAINPQRGYRVVPAGDYTGLFHGKGIVMSDTPDEICDHLHFYHRARGNVLINGLGLGVITGLVLLKPDVASVTVIEIEADVIELVAPHYADPRLSVIQADALTWQPPRGAFYDAVWHDIWPDLTADNLPDMHRLTRRYARRCAWQGSWGRAYCEMQRGY